MSFWIRAPCDADRSPPLSWYTCFSQKHAVELLRTPSSARWSSSVAPFTGSLMIGAVRLKTLPPRSRTKWLWVATNAKRDGERRAKLGRGAFCYSNQSVRARPSAYRIASDSRRPDRPIQHAASLRGRLGGQTVVRVLVVRKDYLALRLTMRPSPEPPLRHEAVIGPASARSAEAFAGAQCTSSSPRHAVKFQSGQPGRRTLHDSRSSNSACKLSRPTPLQAPRMLRQRRPRHVRDGNVVVLASSPVDLRDAPCHTSPCSGSSGGARLAAIPITASTVAEPGRRARPKSSTVGVPCPGDVRARGVDQRLPSTRRQELLDQPLPNSRFMNELAVICPRSRRRRETSSWKNRSMNGADSEYLPLQVE